MFQRNERNKLIALIALFIVVVIVFFASQYKEAEYERQEDEQYAEEPEPVVNVAIDPLDLTPLKGKFSDGREDDRVLLPKGLLDPFFLYSVGFTDAHWKALGVRDLDEAALSAILSEPSTHRGEAYRVRGTLEDVKSRERLDGLTEYKGWLRLDDGRIVHFVLSDFFDAVDLGDYIRIDGLFVKLYRTEVHDGTLAEGPLLVGAKTVRSYPPCGSYDPAVLEAKLAAVTDDTASSATGIDSAVREARWFLMNYASSTEGQAIDWEQARVLDNLTMTEVLKNGEKFRGQPFRIPISQNMGIYTESAGENPLRLDTVTTGWIANMQWVNQAKVIRFIMPGAHPELQERKGEAKLVAGHGFFLKNHSYEPRDGGVRGAPYFVLAELESFTPPESTLTRDVLLAVAALSIFLLIVFPILLTRDRRKSEQLQRDLVRRRQERRRKLVDQSPPTEQGPK